MFQYISRICIAFMILCLFNSAHAQSKKNFDQIKIVVKLNSSSSEQDLRICLQDICGGDRKSPNVKPIFPFSKAPNKKFDSCGNQLVDLTRYFEMSTDSILYETLVRGLSKSKGIDYVERKQNVELLYETNDPSVADQYYLNVISAQQGWDIEKGDSNIIIAIVDTGMDMDHEDLLYNIAYNLDDPMDGLDNDNDGFVDNYRGWDLGDNDNFPQNEMNDHGSLCAGLAAARTDNDLGISGTGFHCKILPIKIQDSDSLLVNAYEGIVYAADAGAKIINCSWGDTHAAQFEQDMVNYAVFNRDALVVGACGNNNDIRNFYPASYENVLSVAATTQTDQKWTPDNTGTSGGSSFGYFVDLSAPGVQVLTTGDENSYRTAFAGTSFSAPIVSGVAGLVRSKYPEMSALQCLEHLVNSVDVIDTISYNSPWQGLLGSGRINLYKAVSDPIKPGLVFRNVEIFDDQENNFENSRIVEFHGELFNYLHDALNVVVNASVVTNNASIVTPVVSIGNVDSLTAVNITGNMLQIELNENIQYDSRVILRLSIVAGNYQKIQYVEYFAAPSYVNLENDALTLSVPANGRFGFVDYYRQAGLGLMYEEFIDLFFDSGWIVGNSGDGLVAAVREQSEFTMISATQDIEVGDEQQHLISDFRAQNQQVNLDLKFSQNFHAWNDLPCGVLCVTNVLNQSSEEVEDLYAGLFTDWEIVRYSRNVTGFDEFNKIAYVEHIGTQKLYAGWVYLSGYNYNHFALDQRSSSAGLIDLTNGLNADEKFYALSHTQHYVGGDNGSDVAQVVSYGPVDISPNDTVQYAFGLIVAQSLFEMQVTADSLRNRYFNLYPNHSSVENQNVPVFDVFPNPSNGKVRIICNLKEDSQLLLYDNCGKCMFSKNIGENIKMLDLNLQTGQFLLKLISKDSIINKKLLIME